MTMEATLNSPSVLDLVRPHASSLCDPCLGRLVARLETGLGNPERGKRLRDSLGAATPGECGLCEDLLRRVPHWADLCVEVGTHYEHDHFLVGSVLFDTIRKNEIAIFEDLKARDTDVAAAFPAKTNSPPFGAGEWLKTEINREVGRLIEARTGKKVKFDKPEVTFRVDTRFDHISVDVADLYARGWYRKFVRDLPQTRWPCRACGGLGCRQCSGSGKTYESSVEELVAAPVVTAAGAEGEAFHGMGREDIDARTLGTGRPFVLELKRPRVRRLDWKTLEAAVNEHGAGKIEVERFEAAGDADAARYKAADPDKTYRARCVAASPLDRMRLEEVLTRLAGATLDQRTPQRVSHRRADLVRKRTVHALRLVQHEGDRFEIEIRAESGTYIKEFVSGDEGRTTPNLSAEIGASCKVVELDVVAVAFDDAGPASPPTPH